MEKRAFERLLQDGWLEDKEYVFASYSSQDWEKVFPCILELRTRGINVLIDVEFQENSSSSWLRNLEERMIRNHWCRGVIAFVSSSYLGSYACLTELIANRTRKQIRMKGRSLPVFYIALEHELETPQQIDDYIYSSSTQARLSSQTVRIEPAEYTKMENFLLDCHLSSYPDRQAVRELLDDIRNRFDVASLINELIFSDKNVMPSIQPFVDAAECAELLKRNFVNNKNESIQMPVLDGLRQETLERLGRSAEEAGPDDTRQTGPDRTEQRPAPPAAGSPMKTAEPRGWGGPKEEEQTRGETPGFPAKQDDANTQYNWGLRYEFGRGVDKSPVLAAQWYGQAARQGHAKAQYNLGLCYYNGSGVEKSPVQAVQWYRLAAEQGHAKAQYNLGFCYYTGSGVGKDPVQAAQWFHKAAEQGHADAQCNLGFCYYNGTGVGRDPAQAAQWFHKAAEQDHANAQYNLGLCYYNGLGVKKDPFQAAQWYRRAAEQDHTNAQYNLGFCYYSGTGIERSPVQAARWFQKAAERGHTNAQYNLGLCYYNGSGVEKDPVLAVHWFREAADQGHAEAQYNLGFCYYNGSGVVKDPVQAAQWFRKAADQGHANAQYNLGVCYYNGSGVVKDLSQAVQWLRKAARQGHAGAQKSLHTLGV